MSKLTFRQSLDLALDYITMTGRKIFPIKAGAKFPPLVKNNLDDASNDPAQIEKWARQFPGCNWGVAHKNSGLMVIDIDTKPGKGGQATFDDLDLQHGFPATEMTRTPSGGFHLIYDAAEQGHIFALGQFGFGDGVDSPNYTIIPGSMTKEGPYVSEGNAPTARAPAWFFEFLASKKRERNVTAGETAVDLNKPENVAWARQFLAEDAEIAIEGKAGDAQTLKIAMGLRDRGISQELAFELMRDIYNERCEPPWPLEELERKVVNGFKYANQSRIGDRTAEADFEGDANFDDSSIRTEWTPEQIAKDAKRREDAKQREESRPDGPRKFPTKKEIITNYAYIGANFDIFISKEDPSLTWKPGALDRHFKSLQPKGKLSDALLMQKSGGIDRHNGLVYLPGRPSEVNGKLNLYRPSDVVPKGGDTSWWNEHLEYLFPNEADRNAVKNWLAWFLQNIDKKPKHALMIQGYHQGVGKTFIANMMRKLLGERNAASVTESDLTGKFNGFAMRAKLLVIEELRAVEQNQVRNRLHDMITEETVSINEKNLPRFDMPNVFGFITFTNMDAAISLDRTDRRYLIAKTDVTPKPPGYYSGLFAKLDDPDALAAVAFELLNHDVGTYSGAGPAPRTAAKEAMIEAGLPELERVLEDMFTPSFEGRTVLISVEHDIVPSIPAEVRRGSRQKIHSWLRRRFDAKEVRVRLGNVRPRLLALNNLEIADKSEEQLRQLYMNRNLLELPKPDNDNANDDFGEADEA